MIESITISGIATYGSTSEELSELSQFNFVFGSNGTGKTTVSRVIADEGMFPTCKVVWKGGTKLQPMVYNHDFVERNFNQSAELKGVFTLGEKQVDKAITAMTGQIATATTDKAMKAAEIRELEKQTTSVQPTIDGINALLSSFGLQGFSLAKAATGTSYKLVRSDGSDAKATLSEGEKTFVTFLYFYHLLKGSDMDSGITTDRVVVFDDPVSSLDSDILFIVGNLIKKVFDEVRAGTSHIKQVFVLTHNVYFHKEVTFNPKRKDGALKEETFWVVRKPGLVSKLDKHPSNPIKTSYELLWAEVRKADRSNLTIQNTLRRILENYFKFFGGIDPKDVCSKFSGKKQIVCNTLLAWINDGSHFAQDDLYMSIDDTAVDNYLNVFKSIFEKSGHSAHYKMMMGVAFEESVNEE
ncbi:MAG: AAA family ATPase [Sulfuricellaceae bacterium]|nr:AAA family ATPase [Sulfuricellaceae bacterium]